jgi:hypothetical protein
MLFNIMPTSFITAWLSLSHLLLKRSTIDHSLFSKLTTNNLLSLSLRSYPAAPRSASLLSVLSFEDNLAHTLPSQVTIPMFLFLLQYPDVPNNPGARMAVLIYENRSFGRVLAYGEDGIGG